MLKLIKVFFVISLFYMANTFALEANCPPGTNTSTTYTITIAGCEYTYQICYNCPVTSTPEWFTVGTYHKVDQSCVNGIPMDAIKDSIINKVLEYRFFLYALCTNTIPPCGSGTVTWVQRDYDCWYKYNDEETGIEYNVCDFSSYCQREYQVCWTQGSGPTLGTPTAWHHVGDSYCDPQTIEPIDPDVGYSSDCWFNSVCNP